MAIDNESDVIDTVQVALRIRPLVESEISRGCEVCLDTIPNEPQVQVKGLAFTYNYVFPPEISQEKFYNDSIKGMVKRLYKGYNVTILAYGQTGSGKTFSMGTCYEQNQSNFYEAGVIPRAVADIFEFTNENSNKYDFKISVSFMELYQEQLYDLLSPQPRDKSIIDIREDTKGIVLPGLTETKVANAEETMSCLVRGSEGRATGATAMNLKSSRSHAIFTIHIQKESKEDRNQSTLSKFHLVDLAGSERSKKTKATGNRFKEGVKINQGLLALGNVISALGDGNKGFVCYRDSKLTRLLQDSLGGNSMTLMIACVSPADYNLDETVSTLRYADRARRIHNKPVVNQDAKSAEIIRLNNTIQQLRLQIINSGHVIPEDYTKMKEQLEEEKYKYITLNQKYLDVIAKNKNLTNLLQKSIYDNTNMVERALLAENAKDNIEQKLTELTQECDNTIEIFKLNVDNNGKSPSNEQMLETFSKIKTQILSVQTEQKSCSQIILEISNEELETKYDNMSPHEKNGVSAINLDESEINDKEEAHALAQVAKNDELKNLMKSIADKMYLAEKLSADNENLILFNESVKESEAKISLLEKQKEELSQQLKTAQQRSKLEPGMLDERRTKMQQLESQISELRRKCAQQASLIKMKEKNDIKIKSLNNEIQQIKAAKVKLIRAMRTESDRFRAWKLQNEKQMAKLYNNDRKMQNEIVKMEHKYNKHQSVLKRKMEDAVATNKRLKEALDRQKNSQRHKSLNSGKVDAVQQWVEEELELMGSLIAAQRTLEGLMDDRGTLNIQLDKLKAANPDDPHIEDIKEDIQLRNAQIADLQQKIVAGDQENKVKTKCDSIQTMVEAKCALKYLFEVAADAKGEIINNKFKEQKLDLKYDELRDLYDAVMTKSDELQGEMNVVIRKHRKELSEVERHHAEKVTTLIRQLNSQRSESDRSSSPSRNLLDRLQILQDAFERIQHKKAELEGENSVLRKEAENVKNKKRKKNAIKKKVLDLTMIKMEEEADEEIEEDALDDPDWIKTPLVRRVMTKRTSDDQTVVKRSNNGQTRCSCKTNCSSKICSCRKLNLDCGPSCKCESDKCANPNNSSANSNSTKNDTVEITKDNQSANLTFNVDSDNDSSIKRQRISDENDLNVLNRDKKKRSFFYHDDAN